MTDPTDHPPTPNLPPPSPGEVRPIEHHLTALQRALVMLQTEDTNPAVAKDRALKAIDAAVKRLELIRADVEDVQ